MGEGSQVLDDLENLNGKQFYETYGVSKKEYRQTQGSLHHPQTEATIEQAMDSSPNRSNANEVADGSSSNPAPNNEGSATDPDAGKPDGKKRQGTAKKKKTKLNRENSQTKGKMVLPKQDVKKIDQVQKMQGSIKEQKRINELNAAHKARREARDRSIQKMGRRGSIGGLGLLGAVVDGVMTYNSERDEDPNGSKLMDAGKAGAVAAGWMFASGLMWSIAGVNAAVGAGKMLYEDANENYQKHKSQSLHITQDASGSNRGTLGGQLIDSENAYTMRQRSEQVMRQHKISTESILGSEARQLHR